MDKEKIYCDFCRQFLDNPPLAEYEVHVRDYFNEYIIYCCKECFEDEMYMFEEGLEFLEYKKL
jgi:RNase P subunit RPR2